MPPRASRAETLLQGHAAQVERAGRAGGHRSPQGAGHDGGDLAANFPKNDDEDRPFLLEACKRKVEEHKFVGWQRELLKKQFLDGHGADLAPTAKLRNLYLFLGMRGRQAVDRADPQAGERSEPDAEGGGRLMSALLNDDEAFQQWRTEFARP